MKTTTAMNEKPKDPESFLTKRRIGNRTPSNSIEQRISNIVGKHSFENCLLETYRNTMNVLKNRADISENTLLKNLYDLKAEILHYCIPHGIDWKKLLDRQHGYLIVKPDVDSAQYYRYIAYNLLLLDAPRVSRYLDFHLVNSVLKPNKKKPVTTMDSKIKFIQSVDFTVVHMLENNMALQKPEVVTEVLNWCRFQMNKFSDSELLKYHEYEFDPNRTLISFPNSNSLPPRYPGCDETLLRTYFYLLTNPSGVEDKPFMTDTVIDYLLWRWFAVGEATNPPEDNIYVTLEEMVFFFKEFQLNFQIHPSRTKKQVTQRQLLEFLYQELPGLFQGVEKETVYKKWTLYAASGSNDNLNWRNNKALREAIGRK